MSPIKKRVKTNPPCSVDNVIDQVLPVVPKLPSMLFHGGENEKPMEHPNDTDHRINATSIATTRLLIQSTVSELIENIEILNSKPKDTDPNQTRLLIRTLQGRFAQLKSLQRQLYNKLNQQKVLYEEEYLKKQIHDERSSLAKQYERTYLQNEIYELKKYKPDHLIHLARNEMDHDEEEEIPVTNESSIDFGHHHHHHIIVNRFVNASIDKNETNNDISTTEWAIENPNHKNTIIQILHGQINERGLLNNIVQQKQSDLVLRTKQLQNKRDFLNTLPMHLQTIERSSQALIKFMTKNNNSNNNNPTNLVNTVSNTIRMSGKDRLVRIETALSLYPPLYTLFSMLQHYSDRVILPSDGANGGDPPTDDVSAITSEKVSIKVISNDTTRKEVTNSQYFEQQQQVILVVPVPEYSVITSTTTSGNSNTLATTSSNNAGVSISISPRSVAYTNSTKRVSIQFRYYSKLSVITAIATGCGSTLNQDTLLDELFPGDSRIAAEQLIATKSNMLQQQENEQRSAAVQDASDVESKAQVAGVAYQWCNILGGLYQVPTHRDNGNTSEDSSVLVQSTRVVMNELIRRVRCNAILKFCIQSFKKNHVPVPPYISQSSDTTTSIPDVLFGWKIVQCSSENSSEFKEKKMLPDTNTTDDDDTNNKIHSSENYVEYQVKFKNGTRIFLTSLSVHKARYPAIPPKWKIIGSSETQSTSDTKPDNSVVYQPLYNPTFAHIENRVNVDLLLLLFTNKNNSPNGQSSSVQYGLNHDDNYCEWIIIHQIWELVQLWDTHLRTTTTTQNHDTVLRTERGRDRVPI